MNKRNEYQRLVRKRQDFVFSEGMTNPALIQNGKWDDHGEIGPWSQWQGCLDAEIVLVGQDWGDIKFFEENEGKDSDDNATNQNLSILFKKAGMEIGTPSRPNRSCKLFFTNAILGIKLVGKMAGKVKRKWATQSTEKFLSPLINIIKPKIIITLGVVAQREVATITKGPVQSKRQSVIDGPFVSEGGITHFAVYHCGKLGLANRNLDNQLEDWNKIGKYLCPTSQVIHRQNK